MGRRLHLLLPALLILTAASAVTATEPACPHDPAAAQKRMLLLSEKIRFHDRLYYQDHHPVITDAEYDHLFAELVHLEGCFPAFVEAGSPTRSVAGAPGAKGAVRHQRPMLSLFSDTGPKAVQALLDRIGSPPTKVRLLVQPKVDGLPIELIYRSGRLVSAATRGDGRQGADVTMVARSIPGVPQVLTGNSPGLVAVRGEVYADRTLMEKAMISGKKRYASARHFAAATLKSRDPDPAALASLRLFPFELVNAEETTGSRTDLAALGILAGWGFPVPKEFTGAVETFEKIRASFQEYLTKRGSLPFAADGIVVKVDDLSLRRSLGEGTRAPFWAAAWKFPPESAKTVVRGIRWKQGRTGRRTPVADLEPVSLGGVRVTHVSLQNAQTVERLGIAAGDRVEVALAADIIPQVISVEKVKRSAAAPERDADGASAGSMTACLKDTPGCRERFLARATQFASKQGLNIHGLGPGRLRKLVEAGVVKDLPSLLLLDAERIAAVPGFGRESARRLAATLRALHPEPFRLLAALGIPGVGPVAARKLAAEYPSLNALMESSQQPDEKVSVGNVRRFFGSDEGKELLKGLREAGLL